MLEAFINFICSLMMSFYEFITINTITNSNKKLLDLKNILLVLLLTIITMLLNNVQYKVSKTLFIFALNVIFTLKIFNLTSTESSIVNAIVMVLINLSELVIGLIFLEIFPLKVLKNTWYLYLITTILIIMLGLSFLHIKIIKENLHKFYKNIAFKRSIDNITFSVLLITGISLIYYNITNVGCRIEYIINIVVSATLSVTALLFIQSKNKYADLIKEYDSLFSYVQNFEEWIEKAQLNRHEYKNQLAVLRCMTNDKKIKDKIDEIIEDSINIEGSVATELRMLPKGGIKGLMYYKTSVALKRKIQLNVTISLNEKGILTKLTEQEVKVICKLIGIYFDNAIEAAAETRKKEVLVEIYELKDKVNIVFSNSFKKTANFENRNDKGISSKGEEHGYGLYFASKIIKNNKWITSKQEVIDKYYIQSLSVTNQK